MILLDENIPEDQCELLRRWRIRFRQIGQSFGHQGMKDEQDIVPLLHGLTRPTLFTRDLGFFYKRFCHEKFAIACLDVAQRTIAHFIRAFLRHPSFNSKAKRMGAVVYIGPIYWRFWRVHAERQTRIRWSDPDRK